LQLSPRPLACCMRIPSGARSSSTQSNSVRCGRCAARSCWHSSTVPLPAVSDRRAPRLSKKNLLRRDPFPPFGASLVYRNTRRYAMADESVILINLLKVKPGKQDALVALLKQNTETVIRTLRGWKATRLIVRSASESAAATPSSLLRANDGIG